MPALITHDGLPAIAGALCPDCGGPPVIVNAAIQEGVQFVKHGSDPDGALSADDGPWPEEILHATCGECGAEVIYPGSGSALDGDQEAGRV